MLTKNPKPNPNHNPNGNLTPYPNANPIPSSNYMVLIYYNCSFLEVALLLCIHHFILLCLAPRVRALSDDVRLTSLCLSRTSGLSREQRSLGRLKLAQRYATSQMTRWTPLSRSKGRRSNCREGAGHIVVVSRTACNF